MARLPVYAAALDQPSNAMPLVDLQQIRERLLAQPWVADVSVSRRLPDTLAIRVVEREPMALWQHQGVVPLADSTRVALPPVDAHTALDQPRIVGTVPNDSMRLVWATCVYGRANLGGPGSSNTTTPQSL